VRKVSHRVKEKAIFALVDQRLDGAARSSLEQHIAECPECRAFHATVRAGKAALAELERQPAPDVNWQKIDAELSKKLEARAEERKGLHAPLLWGAIAATAAAAFLVTWGIVSEPGGRSRGGSPEPDPTGLAKTVEVTPPSSEHHPAPSGPVLAFVTFVAGEAETARGEAAWRPLGLETELDEGVRLRTAEEGTAGIQVGANGAGCRLEPGTEVSLVRFEDATLRLELASGRVTCRSGAEVHPIVVSVVDVVASARDSSAVYAIEREGPQVLVVELAEGTLSVRLPGGSEEELSGPVRLELTGGDEPTTERGALGEAATRDLADPALGLLPRRTIASLHLPAVDGVERVTVDGAEYGPLPLHLRRRPGTAHVLIYPTDGAEPIAHDVAVALGPTRVETGVLLASLPSMRTPPTERRVAPRFGTLDEGQVRRLRSIVGRNVRSCYERTLKRYPNTWGRIHVRFTVSTTGEAKGVRVTSVAGGHPSVNTCVESTLGAAGFPPPRGGRVPIEQTITLSPRF